MFAIEKEITMSPKAEVEVVHVQLGIPRTLNVRRSDGSLVCVPIGKKLYQILKAAGLPFEG